MLEKIGTNCYPITNTIMVPTTVNRTTVYDDTDTSISIGVNKQKNDFTLKNNNLTSHNPLVTNDFEVSETIDHNQQGVPLIKTGFKRNLPMYNQDDDDLDPRKVNRISVHDTYVNQLNDCNMLNVDTRRNIQNNKQQMISPQSVLHQNLSECIKCLCQQMEKNSIPQVTCDTINTNTIANSNTTSSTICSQALDLRMTSPLIVDESPINETWNTSGMLIKALSPSSPLLPSFSSSASSSSSSSCSNNILQQQQQQQRKQQLHYHHECDQHDKVVNLMPTKSSEHFNDTLMNISSYNQYNNYTISSCSPNLAMMDTIPFSLSKMDSSFVSNKLFSNTSSISTLTNTHTQHNLKTQAPLFPRLSSTLLSLSSSDTTTEDSKTVLQTPVKEEIFYKLSEALCLHRSGSQLSLNDNGINDQLMTSDLLNPTEFIWNYAKNYALFTKNNSSENVIEVNKTVEDSSTCPVSETKSNDLENETSSKSEFTDTEKCDSKSTSLWFTESELHSIPNLMESIRKFCSNNECGYEACRSSRLREHYHCGVCNKILLRREEMIRHAKWHKKREESMQYGFMRYSPGDDCTVSACPHNGRQTHYHCMQSNCYKVYISTSDVQMHANYHRKDAVIIQEGFQRFRATENCGIPRCLFYTEHTTHFHCRRSNCHFTFKNKADMEKHKLHHQKNDRFAQDGFRRYIKCENCDFPECQYSGVINHIHCIRPGCDYVVHSSSQIMSHKRKHDRRFASFSPRHMGVVCRDDISQTLSSSNQGNDNDDEDIANTGAKQNLLSSGKYIKDLGENEISLLQNNNLDFGFFSNKNTYPYEVDFNMIEPMSITNLLTEVSKLASLCICRRQHWGELSYDCDNNTNEKCINKDQENSPLCAKIDKILQSIYKSYNHHSSQCLWPDCPSKTNEIDLKQTQESPRTWCKYWLSHLWEACLSFFAYIECDQSNCSMRSRGSHTHCRFWPKCDFINPSGSSNFQVLYEHLFLHNECFAPKLISSSISNQSTCRRNESSDNLVYDASYNIANSRRRGRPPKYTKYVHVPHINPPENLHKDDNYHSDLCYSMFFDQSESRFECQNQTVNENHSISVVDNLHNNMNLTNLKTYD
ncbi:unnamed protein product [Heterobilharzia americana]|nr:unnamed protein product [Heterobilharzia americana]